MINIAIFASGSGSNAEAIMEYFKGSDSAHVVLLASNNEHAYALERAKKFDVPAICFSKGDFNDPQGDLMRAIEARGVDFVVLAGFLWLVPSYMTDRFAGRIVNIHPALLPLHGGKGMYGDRVHEAVIAAGEQRSGITIHYVNEKYDSGDVIFQSTCPVTEDDTPQTLATKIHALEHRDFPQVISLIIDTLTK